MSEITQKLLNKLFIYQDGDLIRKTRPMNSVNIGDVVGYIRKDNYIGTNINGKEYLNHRLIFLMYHGYLPIFLDHIDGNPSNNRIDNLRPVTSTQNTMNRNKQDCHAGKPTSSKYKGVTWYKRNKKWGVHIQIDGIPKYLGLFTSEYAAGQKYNSAAILHFGNFALLNNMEDI